MKRMSDEQKFKEWAHEIGEQLTKLNSLAVAEYTPIVEEFCRPSARPTENEVGRMFDYLFEFAGDEQILLLYKKVCRCYWKVYPETVAFYIMEYRKTYDRQSLVGTEYEYLLEKEGDEEDV